MRPAAPRREGMTRSIEELGGRHVAVLRSGRRHRLEHGIDALCRERVEVRPRGLGAHVGVRRADNQHLAQIAVACLPVRCCRAAGSASSALRTRPIHAAMMQHHGALLLWVEFHCHEPHRRPRNRFTDRFCMAASFLPRLT